MNRELERGGRDPDPRFTLANERTFLAWNRTALALIGGGLAAGQLLQFDTRAIRLVVEIVPILLGDPNPSPMMVNWGLSETLSYLRHLEQLEEAERVESEPAERWSLAA